ncbi:hypothetical protein HZC08_00295, partial [Candidatus Micrarchaeota archaeon]|nr:hypothetical protein [Candidatus Micrarchaeota archaeon]
MIRIPLIYLKDKQAFFKEAGTLRLAGKPTDLAKKWKKEGVKLIHIVDLDAQAGKTTNFDLYDALSYVINIQVEGVESEEFIEKLVKIGTRIVIALPTNIDLKKFKEYKKLLVGKINQVTDIENVYDVILDKESKSILEIAK